MYSTFRSLSQKMTKSSRRNDFSSFIDKLLQHYEGHQGSDIQVNSLALDNHFEKRRLYDLLNVLAACDICSKYDTHTYKWNTILNIHRTVEKIAADFETKALSGTIEDIFRLPDSPSIGVITHKFIGTFLFFNMKIISIRDVAMLMAIDQCHFKPILRRLYLVAYILERIGLFKHSQKKGTYQIEINCDTIHQKVISQMQKENRFPRESIEFQLNRFDIPYLRTTFSSRQAIFTELLSHKVLPDTQTDKDIDNVYISYYPIDI